MFKKTFLTLLPIFLVVLLFYFPVINTYFTGDDFFHFRVAEAAGAKGVLYMFGFHPFAERGIAFYRPIFRELLYLNFYNLFGLNQLPFRIFQFFLLFANIGLSFVLIEKLFKRRVVSFLTALFVGISGANVGILYYLAGGVHTSGATIFFLLTIIFFLNYLEKGEVKYKAISFITFFLSLASDETAIAALPLMFYLMLAHPKKLTRESVLQTLKELWPLVLAVLAYLYLQFKVIGYSKEEIQYKPVFGIKNMMNTASWYGAWALGLPEMVVDFVGHGFRLNPNLMKYWSDYFRIIFPTFFVSIIIIIISFIYVVVKKANLFLNKNFLFLVIWFPLGLLPVVILPLHKSSHYLSVSLPAFWGIVFYVVFNAYDLVKRRTRAALVLFAVFVGSLIALSFSTSQLAKTTYWARTRGDYAKQIIDQIKTKYPDLPNNSILYIKNDPDYPFIASDWGGSSKQAFFILNGNDAINLLYKDKSVNVYYEDMGGLPDNVERNQVFELMVKIF